MNTLEDVLLNVLRAEYGGTEQDWTGMRSLQRVANAVRQHMADENDAKDPGYGLPYCGPCGIEHPPPLHEI